ncbi:MAG: 50S ribosomal protein L18 [Deltaproteobacteria bacterium]|nr:50S ribosomal protein L18 [Deltaproteobacteria bacterium]MBW2415167.1 50S ribosomal protein L18 [Deltaproteobacteria bacterium]
MAVPRRRELWKKRKVRVRKQLRRTEIPLLTVFRSSKHIYASLTDPLTGKTLTSVSTRSPSIREGLEKTGDKAAAKKVGEAIAAAAIQRKIERVAFNRNGFIYAGRIKALADAAREAGLRL